jgi:outer membrane protein assembly factor BamA
MRWIAWLLLLVTPAIGAQGTAKRKPAVKKPAAATPAVPPKSWPIEGLRVEGNRVINEKRILTAAALKLGQLAGKEEFDAARERIAATGAFASVAYHYDPAPGGKGIRGTFEVTEVAQILPYRFRDLPATDAELRPLVARENVLLDNLIPATDVAIERAAKAVAAFVAKRGFKDIVAGRVRPQGETLAVVFGPTTPPPSVAEVRFTGTQVVPLTTLQNTVAGVAVGVTFDEPYFRQLLDTSIRPLYEARGRIRVAFPKITTEPAKDVNGVAVNVEVNEGPGYTLGEVRLEGIGGDTAPLYRAANFKSGELVNIEDVNLGIERIIKRLRHNGYMKSTSTTERKIDDKKKTVDLVIRFEPGARYMFGKVRIEGLDLIGEAAVKKLWAPKEGQPFDADYPEYFLSRVREDGVFDNLGRTKSAIQVNEQEHTADVTLIFYGGKESKPAAPR